MELSCAGWHRSMPTGAMFALTCHGTTQSVCASRFCSYAAHQRKGSLRPAALALALIRLRYLRDHGEDAQRSKSHNQQESYT